MSAAARMAATFADVEHEAAMAALARTRANASRALDAIENLPGVRANDEALRLRRVVAEIDDIEGVLRRWEPPHA